MINLFRNKTNYLPDLEEFIISLGYKINHVPYVEIIPQVLYRESKFQVIRFENLSIGKQIELYVTSNNTIASFTLFDLNHSTPTEQYCNPQLMTNLGRLDKEEFNHFETFGFKNFGKNEFNRTKKVMEKNIDYLISPKKFPIGNLFKYPGFTDLCNVKLNISEVMTSFDYKLIFDGSQYNPKFTKPNLWYEKDGTSIKFVRVKSRDENIIYAVKGNEDISKRIFQYGTYEAGKQFTDKEWNVIKSKLHRAMDDDQKSVPSS